VTERATTKFKVFYDTLPADERAVLAIALRQGPDASEQADDTTGYAAPVVVAFLAGYLAKKGLDSIWDRRTIFEEAADKL